MDPKRRAWSLSDTNRKHITAVETVSARLQALTFSITASRLVILAGSDIRVRIVKTPTKRGSFV